MRPSSRGCASASNEAGRIVALLQDLSGPKIRTGELRGGAPVSAEDRATRSPSSSATSRVTRQRVSTTYADLPKGVHPGDALSAGRWPHPAAGDRASAATRSRRWSSTGGARRAQGHQRAWRRVAGDGLTEKDIDDLHFGVRCRRRFRRAELRAERGRASAGADGDRAGRRHRRSRSSPSWSGRRPSRGSRRSSARATP